ncbi:hypothetical protein POTOM_059263 [Populus tomentosa]|uniref:Uncharacterized protein n=1 Tax=Populus tomentosa TaxID=118781 RepID=A0A8X7XWN4_POPTO|nr:hypothetical protein POTOM_059263 [Populus tomentosa]
MGNFNQEHLFLSCLLTWYRQRIPSYTTPDQVGSCKILNVPIELNSFENVHFLCFEDAVLITHQSKGKCELQIQTFREFSAQTSNSQK